MIISDIHMMDLLSLALTCIAFIAILIIIFVGYVVLTSTQYPLIQEYEEESTFLNPHSKQRIKFPSLKDPPSLTLSVVVPAYNEEDRLPPMLEECISYLKKKSENKSFSYEIIIVDDGSRDKTTEIGLQYCDKYNSDRVRVLTLSKNRGKGGAVRLGVLRARGEFILFADADGATKFSDFEKLEASISKMTSGQRCPWESLAIVCGSRAHLEQDAVATRSVFRTVLMYGFHFLVAAFAVKGIRDTQCGFKLLTRRAAAVVFNSLHVERWAFDVEMLFMAQKLGIPIDEVAVTWTEIEGSKVTPVISWIQMGLDLILIWFKYTIGVWKIKGDFSPLEGDKHR